MAFKYASFEGYPCVYDDDANRGWVMFNPPNWQEMPFFDITQNAASLRPGDRERLFNNLDLPKP